MSEEKIQCPGCGIHISLTEAITAEIREDYRKKYKEAVAKREQEIKLLQNEIEKEKQFLDQQREEMGKVIAERLQIEKQHLEAKLKENIL